MKPALKLKNDIRVTLKTGVSTSGKVFVLETGDGADLTAPINGAATSAGTSTLLNVTGASGLGINVLDEIWNVTDNSHALVLAVATNSITTTPLRDGSGNTWDDTDEFSVNPFPLTLVRYASDGTTEVQKEIIRIYKISGDILTADANGRAVDGTTALEWIPGDSLEMKAIALMFHTLQEKQNYLRSFIEGAASIPGLKTFLETPLIPDQVYGSGWNGNLGVATKNAIYDKIESLAGGVTVWTGLTDTPSSITADEVVVGNPGGTALEFSGDFMKSTDQKAFPQLIYDGGNQSIVASTTYTKTHNLGVTQSDIEHGRYKGVLAFKMGGYGSQYYDTKFKSGYFGYTSSTSIGADHLWSTGGPPEYRFNWDANNIKFRSGSSVGVNEGRLLIYKMW